MLLYLIGPVVISVYPYNVHEVTKDSKTDFAEKSVLGTRPPLEHVGEGAETIKLSGRIFPQTLPGGLEMQEALQAVRESGEPQFLLRGDGAALGWFVIETVNEKSQHLDPSGVGQYIEIETSLKRADAPGPGGAFASLIGLFE